VELPVRLAETQTEPSAAALAPAAAAERWAVMEAPPSDLAAVEAEADSTEPPVP